MNPTRASFRRPLTANEEDILAGGYWHCTTPANFRRILRSGAILPNLGRFRPQHGLSPQSKCALAGGVSLFEPWHPGSRSSLLTWLGSHKPITVALRLDPAHIRPRALQRDNLSQWPGGILLRGEVCVCGPIPLACCTGILLIASGRRSDIRWVEPFDRLKARAALRELAAPRKRDKCSRKPRTSRYEHAMFTSSGLLAMLDAKARRGSKPRCHGITHGSKEVVAERLTRLIAPFGIVTSTDRWMPEGFAQTDEAELHKATRLLTDEDCEEVRRWWFKISRGGQQRSPNFDIASTCTIGEGRDARPGVVLVEAKAHEDELRTEEKGKKLPTTEGEQANDQHIGEAIRMANDSFAQATKLPWALSHRSCYQMANRFTLAWKLTALGYPVILVYLGFLHANEMPIPFSGAPAWEALVKSHGADAEGTPVSAEVWNRPFILEGQQFIALIRSMEWPLDPEHAR